MATTEQSRTPDNRAEFREQNVQVSPVPARKEPRIVSSHSEPLVFGQSMTIDSMAAESTFSSSTFLTTQLETSLHGTFGFAQYCDCALCEDVKDGQTSNPPARFAASAHASDLMLSAPTTDSTEPPSLSHICVGPNAVYPPDNCETLFSTSEHGSSAVPRGTNVKTSSEKLVPSSSIPPALESRPRQDSHKDEVDSWCKARSNRFGLRIVRPPFGRAIETRSLNDEEGEADEIL
ncbi:hypothetical protein PMZ80_001322 [Knufia obscura]|uniref:Uncharacterized protein n=2 Tax=Knufia TaxID=430999 RepID=A0AAN8EL46_9EURO|nr:hypothetical protein PMZ80_001322 [Knufia obscura]KAK5956275.1 hypothetical protein OHC33_002851 [Knufia fluminis]